MPAPVAPPAPDRELHVWRIDTRVGDIGSVPLVELLSGAERTRAAALRFERDRRRFVVAHAALRTIVSRYLCLRPQQVALSTESGQPPRLLDDAAMNLHLSLAHSGDLALCAVACGRTVGVDIEQHRPVADRDGIVSRFFSPAVARAYHELPPSERPAAFLSLWTRCEACLKVMGTGLANIGDVVVPVSPGHPATMTGSVGDASRPTRWTLHDLAPAAGYVGAVAVDGDGLALRCWSWDAVAAQWAARLNADA